MPDTLHELVKAEKLIAAASEWTRKGRRLELKLPLEIDGLIEEGLFLRASALERLPDREVVFQLEYHGVRIPGEGGPLARVEWNSIRPHNNKGIGPPELRFLEQSPSHMHLFEDNWSDTTGALRGDNLPVARPVPQPIQGFDECLRFVGSLFRINNITLVKTPEWVYSFDL
ncbi:hypothetical protein [Sandarakinorhabdus sp.]|uniref:hypothetical protein n=1 Tax=Sandarakinorhabdus sp. TaxID=1916663 RepID=UPI00286E4D3E|nr:hypothetical protein [Sandarakinorhabdus sp.]